MLQVWSEALQQLGQSTPNMVHLFKVATSNLC